jgi:CheY-like chemotaxis protein
VLQADGVQVEAVTDAREGLRLSTEQEFDLVLSDLKMPGMSGCEFHRELHKVRPELASRIIFATGDLPALAVSEFSDGPTPQILMKPFSFSQLRLAISTRLGELRPAA